jgi:putative SOS response-associated peptidase YedK
VCGRFVRNSSTKEIAREFNIQEVAFDFKPSYNIAPSQDVLLVINDGHTRLIKSRWGFIPSWSKDPSIGNRMINARGESVSEKPSFKSSFNKHRGLVVADGFFEWRKEGDVKIPVYVYLKSGKPFGMAGLYSYWISPEGEEICTSTIITTEANEKLEPVHDRMPVIIPKTQESLWLDPGMSKKDMLLSLLKPYPAEDMDCHDVSKIVNSPKNDSPDNIMPI